MTTEDRVNKFLQAEEQANRLIDELETLRRESDSYRSAADRLDKAGDEVAHLTQRLDEIGMPALLEAQQAVLARIDEVKTRAEERGAGIASLRRTVKISTATTVGLFGLVAALVLLG